MHSALPPELQAALDFLRSRFAAPPQLGFVLGSGLGHFTQQLEDVHALDYADIPHMPQTQVAGHGGQLITGYLDGTSVACLSGRVHLYEGHPPSQVVFGVRLLALWGCKVIVLTNAAGGIAPDCTPGSLLLITDHLNLTGQSPLTGPNWAALGPRFPDMSYTYSPRWNEHMRSAAQNLALPLREGVYAGMLGPAYETPAEVRMLERLGASVVGMSTVHETLALNHMGVAPVALSCVTNFAAGKSDSTLHHEEVAEVAARAQEDFSRLLREFTRRVASEL